MPLDCGGAAVGAAFSSLLLLVQTAAITVDAFCPQLKKIKSTLKGMEPSIKEICNIYERLGRLEEMDPIKEVLSEGNRLVSECKKIPCYNMYKRYKHSNKLTKYNATLIEKFPNLILLLAAKNLGEMLTKMEEKGENLSSIRFGQANGQAIQSGGNLAVPAAPPLILGSEIEASLGENILPLLEEEVPAVVGDGPGG